MLATAVPKGDRFDWLIEKATELGVERVIPIVTERSVVDPGTTKLERLRRAIIEASKQCGRNRLMVLSPPIPWDQMAATATGTCKFLADRGGAPLAQFPAIDRGTSVTLAVGPEGGFTPAEQQVGAHHGWHAVNLGVHTLRIETAGLAGAAALLARVKEPIK
jgi:16S rRNA (uracil1498-N3)-methyltransferase